MKSFMPMIVGDDNEDLISLIEKLDSFVANVYACRASDLDDTDK